MPSRRARYAQRSHRLPAVVAAAAILASAPAQAIDAVWLGGDGDWYEENWSTGYFPGGGGYRAVIDGLGLSASFVGYGVNASASGLRIGSLDTLAIGGETLTLTGDASIDGRLWVVGNSVYKGIRLTANPVTFSGQGVTELGDSSTAFIRSDAGSLMTIAAGHRLIGGGVLGSTAAGQLHGGLLNLGRIEATGQMALDTGGAAFVNKGVVTVSGNLNAAAATNNTEGLFEIQANAGLGVGGYLAGGTLRGGSGSRLWGGRLGNLTLEGSFSVPAGQSLALTGQINNMGELFIIGPTEPSSTAASIHIVGGNTVFSGSGSTILGNGQRSAIHSDADSLLTIAVGHTLRGSGQLGTGSVGQLLGGLRNEGLIKIETEYGMGIDTAGASFSNVGQVHIADGSVLTLAENTHLVGGTVVGAGWSRLRGGRFQDLTLQGTLEVGGGTSIRMSGTINNQGVLLIAGSQYATSIVLDNGATTLAGSGQTLLGDGTATFIRSDADSPLTIAAGHTLRGGGWLGRADLGYLQGGLVNEGRLVTDHHLGVAAAGAGFVNRGLLQVSAGTTLNLTDVALRQDAADAVLDLGGTLLAPAGVQLMAGRLQGSGVLQGDLDVDAATLAPGSSPGTLQIGGALTLQDSARLEIEADGLARGTQHDWLAVGGEVLLDGTVLFGIGYGAALGDSWTFLTGSSIGGVFDTVLSPGFTLALDYGSNFVTATVVGISPVPEPQTWALWLGGLALLSLRRARMSSFAMKGPRRSGDRCSQRTWPVAALSTTARGSLARATSRAPVPPACRRSTWHAARIRTRRLRAALACCRTSH
jgi:hypothetical protein